MIYVLYTPNSLSCKKSLNFFKTNNIDIKKINLLNTTISEKKIYDILYLTSSGFKDIINEKHLFLRSNNIDINKIKLKEMVHLLQHEPIILKKPIILQYKNDHPYRLMVGYNKNDIKIFLRKS